MIEASFDPKKTNAASVAGAVQYDKGQRLLLRGLPSPEELAEKDEFLSGEAVVVEVHFAYDGDTNTEARAATYNEFTGAWMVEVPNVYLERNYPVQFFVYVNYGATEDSQRTKTMYTGAFTPKGRPAPSDNVTQDQLNRWDVLVADVQLAITNTNKAAGDATTAANAAKDAAVRAEQAVKTANEAYEQISKYEMDSVKSVNGSTPDSAGNVSVKIGVSGAKKDQIAVFDDNGNLVSSQKSLTAFTRVTMVLDGTTLKIQTVT